MTLLTEVQILIHKELLVEWRQKYAIGGILLYVVSTVFIVYFSFSGIDAKAWNTLFWIIMLFASVNAVTKSFVQENSQRELYYYSLARPIAILLAKIIYNAFLLLIISGLTYFVFSVLAINPVKNADQFFLALLLGSIGFSIAFTFISAIAGKAANSSTLMAILSFPAVIPILMTLLKISANALGLMTDTGIWKDIGILVAIDLIMLTLTFILFPFLWRD
jgi:ABC-type transport system involved in cytochrome c biogenesis, permease component